MTTSKSNSMKAFTPRSLIAIRRALSAPYPPTPLPPHTASSSSSRPPNESAVLIPLMNINERPYVMMQVRAQKMRAHPGEVSTLVVGVGIGLISDSFPGGKADHTDKDLVHTALREAHEELAIPPSNVEMLGVLEPEYSLGNTSRVWPFVGYVHPTEAVAAATAAESDIEKPLPSFPLSTLKLSQAEVSALLPLPLDTLADPARHSLHFFRLNTLRPYHRIRVADLAIPYDSFPSALNSFLDHARGTETRRIADGIPRDLEAWGLSGWFLNKLAERVGWLAPPPVPPLPED